MDTGALQRLRANATRLISYRLRCRECGGEPGDLGGGVLACEQHPSAGVEEFRGVRLRSREVAVESRSTTGFTYRVLVGIDGRAQCTCRGYEERGACAHTVTAEEIAMNEQNTTALAPIKVTPPQSILPTKGELEVIGLIARSVVGARGMAVPAAIDHPAKAAAIMIAGFELGVPPMTALRHIFTVNGKTEPDAQLMAGIVMAREPGSTIEVVEQDDEHCTARIVRPSHKINAEYTYYLADAKRAGLVKSGNNWDKFPKDMMRWAAFKRLCRAYAADLINSIGIPVSEDLDVGGDIEDGGAYAVIDGVVSEVTPEQAAARVAELPEAALYAEGDVEPTPEHIEPQTPYEVILQAVAPILMTEQNADTIEDDANAALGGIGMWIEQYGDGTEAVQSAVEIAEAVAAELSAGAPSVALAADKVHRARAEAGQPFNAEAVAADAAPARSSRRQTAAQPPLE